MPITWIRCKQNEFFIEHIHHYHVLARHYTKAILMQLVSIHFRFTPKYDACVLYKLRNWSPCVLIICWNPLLAQYIREWNWDALNNILIESMQNQRIVWYRFISLRHILNIVIRREYFSNLNKNDRNLYTVFNILCYIFVVSSLQVNCWESIYVKISQCEC